MLLDLRRLRSFVAVADTLHFGRAAERLHLAQPALTQHVQQLEKELDVRLLERDRRHVQLTRAGALFLDEARRTLAQAERAERFMASYRRGERGRIELGHVSSIAYSGLLSRLYRRYREQVPHVQVDLHEVDAEQAMAWLDERQLDAVLLRLPAGPVPENVQVVVLQREVLQVCLPEEHVLAGADAVPLQALAGEAFVATHLHEGLGFYDVALRACRQAGFTPVIVDRSPQFVTLASLVAAGRGIALVPASVARVRLPGVVYRPLQPPTPTSEVALACREDSSSPALQGFLALCRALADESVPG